MRTRTGGHPTRERILPSQSHTVSHAARSPHTRVDTPDVAVKDGKITGVASHASGYSLARPLVAPDATGHPAREWILRADLRSPRIGQKLFSPTQVGTPRIPLHENLPVTFSMSAAPIHTAPTGAQASHPLSHTRHPPKDA